MAAHPGMRESGDGAGVSNLAIQLLRTIAQQISALTAAVTTVFPQQTGTAPTATGGSETLPGAPAGFIVVTLPSGAIAKIPFYND